MVTSTILSGLYEPIQADLADAERIFDEELASGFAFVDNLCRVVRAYRGKLLRPALLLLSGKAAGTLTDTHPTLAAVVELVHVATLVHDDVLDESEQRRCQPTIRALRGNVAAVLLGDYLISHAFHLCSSIPSRLACRRIGAATNVVCEGELLQTYHRGNAEVSESLYLDMVRRKTGALTAVSCELGAHYAGGDEPIVAALRAFGESAGSAFQIVDDVLDFAGDRDHVGKSIHRDLPSGKLTLPAIHCLANHTDPKVKQSLLDVLSGERPFDAAEVRRWFAETGSMEYALATAAEHVALARRRLDVLPPSDAKSSLTALAEFILSRTY